TAIEAIVTLLTADAQAHVVSTMREAFVADDRPLGQAAALKAQALQAGAAAGTAVGETLRQAPWRALVVAGDPKPEDLPPLAQAAEIIQGAANAALEAAGLSPEGSGPYRLPRRFIDGENLPQLVRTLSKSLQQLQALDAQRQAQDAGANRAARRQAWDDA
ncbi:MAG: hypothetical protein KC613_23635, partial [Myxococcales bacterium]|nr:hypothetical protein [Myxococcales bacterium]